jgi:polysaccharide export outer membrane protein
VLVVAAFLAGCNGFPASGPPPGAVETMAGSSSVAQPYVPVKLTPYVVDVLRHVKDPTLQDTFIDRRPSADLKLGIGDVVSVSVFEAAPGGLFTPPESSGARPGNFVQIPPQIVANNGTLAVPYAGAVPAAGRSIHEVESMIVDRLRSRAIEPQVVISLVTNNSQRVSVLGDVNQPTNFPIASKRDRILDALSRAGGIKYQGFETKVTLQRGGKTGSTTFDDIVKNPANNLFLQPNDSVYVSRDPKTFVILGASGAVINGDTNLYYFEQSDLNLAQAVGRGAGLADFRADPRAVYLYRMERRSVVDAMTRQQCAGTTNCEPVARIEGELVPVIYIVDFRDPSGYFLASELKMRNRDIVYIGNAPEYELSKVIDLIYRSGSAIDSVRNATN